MPSHRPYPHARPFQESRAAQAGAGAALQPPRHSHGSKGHNLENLEVDALQTPPCWCLFHMQFWRWGCRGESPAASSPLAAPTQVTMTARR